MLSDPTTSQDLLRQGATVMTQCAQRQCHHVPWLCSMKRTAQCAMFFEQEPGLGQSHFPSRAARANEPAVPPEPGWGASRQAMPGRCNQLVIRWMLSAILSSHTYGVRPNELAGAFLLRCAFEMRVSIPTYGECGG